MAEAHHHRIELAVGPVAREFGEVLIQHVVERIVGGVQLFDISGRVQLLHEFTVREDDVVGAWGRLRDQAQHVVSTGVVFRLELHVVGRLELGDDVRLTMAIPCQHVDFCRRGPGP